MEFNKSVSQLTPGMEVEGFFILSGPRSRTTNAGKPFLSAALTDRTGRIEAVCWDYPGPIGAADEGKIVKVRGSVSDYRGNTQLVIERIRLAEAGDEYDSSNLVPTAPIDAQASLDEIDALIASMADGDYRAVCSALLSGHRRAFSRIPAAKSVHHDFISGLLMHTLNMLRTADFLAGLYADTVDRSLLLAGTLLHDFAKEREFAFSDLGLVTDYTPAGELLGHLVIGAQLVAEKARELGIPEDKSMLLQHMILSHHGEPEFGAAVRPKCAESELLSYIDLIDSRMEIYRKALAELPEGAFSGRIFALEKRIYKHGQEEGK